MKALLIYTNACICITIFLYFPLWLPNVMLLACLLSRLTVQSSHYPVVIKNKNSTATKTPLLATNLLHILYIRATVSILLTCASALLLVFFLLISSARLRRVSKCRNIHKFVNVDRSPGDTAETTRKRTYVSRMLATPASKHQYVCCCHSPAEK